MANTLGGVTIAKVAATIVKNMEDQIARLEADGMSGEEARKVLAEAVNNLSWNMGCNPSPLDDGS